MGEGRFSYSSINQESIKKVLGINEDVPLSLEAMIANLQLTSFINPGISARLQDFTNDLIKAFTSIGVRFTDFDKTLNEKGKVAENTTILYPIEPNAEDIAINHVSSLFRNPIVGIFDRKAPVNDHSSNQERLDTIVTYLTSEIIHIAIFLDHDSFTVCSMNGAVIKYSMSASLTTVIRESLVSKLTAQVVPPEILSEIDHRHGKFDATSEQFKSIMEDMEGAAKLLHRNGLLMSHLQVDAINFRSPFHKRIATSYLDERSGMSYGFLVWQLPAKIPEAKVIDDKTDAPENSINVRIGETIYTIEIPEVWVLSTRSGCDKTHLTVSRDIVRMGLVKGRIVFDYPLDIESKSDCKPSYDSLTILASALGNVINASLLKSISGECQFTRSLENSGLTLFHWHGYPLQRQIPFGFFVHGHNNPAVSCSTAQSAIYTLRGKIEALKDSLNAEVEYRGDIHIEPHHGSNVSSFFSLTEVIDYIILHD